MSKIELDSDKVERIAHLARLALTEEEKTKSAKSLSNILNFVAALEEADTKDVEPMAHPMEVTQRRRPDESTANCEREKFQALAPKVEAGLYLVPKVIE